MSKTIIITFFRTFYGVVDVLFSLLKIRFKRIEHLAKDDDTLRICGNGSSLKDENSLTVDSSIKYAVVNRHVLSDNYLEIKPSYYILADKHFFKHEEGRVILERINELTTWEMTLFTPYGTEVAQLFTNPQIKTVHFSDIPFTGFERTAFWLFDKQYAMPKLQNVINGALMIGIWLGYKHIELYGVEHSWTKSLFVDDDNDVCLYNDHFYDNGPVPYRKVSSIQDGEKRTLATCLRNYAMMFESYWKINAYAHYKGCEIVNCTKNSFIDAFKRRKR